MAEMVSKEFLFYCTDFLIDELSQNAYLASDIKNRIRAAADNYPQLVSTGGDAVQAGGKRKGAPGAGVTATKVVKVKHADHDEEMVVVDNDGSEEEATKKKKKQRKEPKQKRKINWHNVWVSAGMDALGQEKNKGAFAALAPYKKTLSQERITKFEEDYEPVLKAMNDSPERIQDHMKTLLRNRNKELGIERHEAFDGLEDFVAEHLLTHNQSGKLLVDGDKAGKPGVEGGDDVAAPADKKGKGKGVPTKRQKATQEGEAVQDKVKAALVASKKQAPGGKAAGKKQDALKPPPAANGADAVDPDDDEEEEEDEQPPLQVKPAPAKAAAAKPAAASKAAPKNAAPAATAEPEEVETSSEDDTSSGDDDDNEKDSE